MVPRVSVTAGPRKQLDRFQAVVERDRIGTVDKRRQIAGKCYASHLCPVAVRIVGAPAGLNGMHITGSKRWTQQRMAAIDSCVEQTDARNLISIGRKLGSLQ